MSGVPPRAERILRWSLAPSERPAILGDLEEEYAALSQSKGETRARRWYRRQVLWSIAPNLWRRVQADPRRLSLFHRGMAMAAIGLLQSIPRLLNLSGSSHAMSGSFWLFGGLTQIVAALFHKRLVQPPRQQKIRLWWLGGTFVAFQVVAYWHVFASGQWEWTLLWLCVAIVVWPFKATDTRVEVKVQPKGAPPIWSLELPTEPLGLSGLVLHHTRSAATTAADHLPPVTIDRTFTPGDSIRVRAAVNLPAGLERASVELIDGQGKQVWQVAAPIITGTLIEAPATPDDLADRDLEEHFGLIDETVRFTGLVPGRYWVRVTVAADGHTSSRDEPLTIAASRPRPSA